MFSFKSHKTVILRCKFEKKTTWQTPGDFLYPLLLLAKFINKRVIKCYAYIVQSTMQFS